MKEAVVASLIISLVILLEILVASLPTPLLLICASLAMLILIPATYFNLRNRRNAEKGTDHRDQDQRKKRALHILRPVAVGLFLAIWGVGRYRIAGQYSYRSPGVDSFAGSFLTRLTLRSDGSGQMWQNEGVRSDFRVNITWTSTPEGIDIAVPEYKHWSYRYYSIPGIHHFQRQGPGLTHVGKKEAGQLQPNGKKHGMAEKRFRFRKRILQL